MRIAKGGRLQWEGRPKTHPLRGDGTFSLIDLGYDEVIWFECRGGGRLARRTATLMS